MFIDKPAPFISRSVDEPDQASRRVEPGKGLSRIQKKWLGVCMSKPFNALYRESICHIKRSFTSTQTLKTLLFRDSSLPMLKT